MTTFTIKPKDTDNSLGWSKCKAYGVEAGCTQKRIFLFMIGGSGASIMQPFLSIFADQFTDKDIHLIPIFIDRHFNSAHVSQGIQSIDYYRLLCNYQAKDIKIFSPYLFVDDETLFKGSNQLLPILHKIEPRDHVIFSYSINNRQNIELKSRLTKKIQSFATCKVSNLIFLPYFRLDNCDETPDDFLQPMDLVKGYIEQLSISLTPEENAFYVGSFSTSYFLSTPFQRNPFHVVSLIQAYSILYSSLKLTNDIKGQHFSFTISDQLLESHSLKDIIPGTELRDIVVKNDYRELIWQELVKEDFFSNYHYRVEPEIIGSLSSYLKESTDLINKLGDSTINPSLQLYLRKKSIYNYEKFWRYLKRPMLNVFEVRYTKKALLNEIKKLMDIDKITTENMVIHEVLVSINRFIDIHWNEITTLYY